MLQRENFILEHRLTSQYTPLTVLHQARDGAFHAQGSLDAILKAIIPAQIQELTELTFDAPELTPIELEASDKEWLQQKHGLTYEKTFVCDASPLADHIIDYMKTHVLVQDKHWKQVLGKHIWIVVKAVYACKVNHHQSERLLWRSTETQWSTVSSTPVVVAFKCIRLSINQDGTIGEVKEF